MTRSEMIRCLANANPNLPLHVVELAVKTIVDSLVTSLQNNNRVEIRKFGTFTPRYLAARLVRNPRTGEVGRQQAKYKVHFKPGKELKERVNISVPVES